MSLTALMKRIQEIMRKDPGIDGDVQRLMQLVWLIFLKVFDYKEEMNELNDDYNPVIPEGYRWKDWADPRLDNAPLLTGQELITFVNTRLIPVLCGDAVDINGESIVVFSRNDERALLVKQFMKDASNLMKNGYFLREALNILNEINLSETSDNHEFSEMYEGLLDGLQAMGKYGEFHTVKAITKFCIDKVDPKLGETVADWACGTGGFLVDTVENLREQIHPDHDEDIAQLQKSVIGGEFKPMTYRLCITNLLLHGIDLPNIRYGDSLDIKNFNDYCDDDLVDVACLNPPYGGIASDSDKKAFPADMRSAETADLFVALTVRRLKKNGRAVIVIPDGFLFGNDSAKVNIKKYLLRECDLHTVIRLPQSCFAPYTYIATNLLFFDKTGPTKETWFYRLDMPEGYKHFSKTRPMKREHFAPVDEWWNNRVEILDKKTHARMRRGWQSKKYSISDIEANGYNLDLCGYPTEEKVILLPEDTIKTFFEQRAALEAEMDAKLQEILDLLEVK